MHNGQLTRTMSNRLALFAIRLAPLALAVTCWELAVRNDGRLAFYFGSPSEIMSYVTGRIGDGSLLNDSMVTLSETVLGFLIGNVLGVVIGMALWYSRSAFVISKPYVIALGAIPIFALSPLLIIWFGTGLLSKVMIAALSTVFVALFQAYTGASAVDPSYVRLMKSMGATRSQVFRKVIAPASIVWVTAAFKLNVSFALLGAFIGEFISSTEGLGHLILVASGLFDMSLVLTGVLFMALIALGLNALVIRLERPIMSLVVRAL